MKTILFSLAFAIMLPIVGRAQEQLLVESTRPLAAAIGILEKNYDWQINYEDPPYTDPRDLVDRTHPNYKGPGRSIDPRGGRLDIRYSVSPSTGKPDPVTVLQMLIDDHVKRANPGQFQIRVVGGLYSVIPAQGSILDTAISLPEIERNYMDTLIEILRALSAAIGVKVAGPAFYTSRPERFKIGANNEPAREVLLRLFEAMKGYQFSWHLLYGPNWGYALNVFAKRLPEAPKRPKKIVMKEVTLPDGVKAVIPVEVPP